jgi:hypothetical protein
MVPRWLLVAAGIAAALVYERRFIRALLRKFIMTGGLPPVIIEGCDGVSYSAVAEPVAAGANEASSPIEAAAVSGAGVMTLAKLYPSVTAEMCQDSAGTWTGAAGKLVSGYVTPVGGQKHAIAPVPYVSVKVWAKGYKKPVIEAKPKSLKVFHAKPMSKSSNGMQTVRVDAELSGVSVNGDTAFQNVALAELYLKISDPGAQTNLLP